MYSYHGQSFKQMVDELYQEEWSSESSYSRRPAPSKLHGCDCHGLCCLLSGLSNLHLAAVYILFVNFPVKSYFK